MSEINAIATNNYLLATQQEVSHDNTLSGNGTSASPLGVAPITVVQSGSFNINTTYASGASYIDWYELSNGMCRIKGWLRPTTAMPKPWNAVTIATGGVSAFFNETTIPTVIDWEGWADYIHWKDDGSLTFASREVQPSASNRLIMFDYLGINRRA